MLGKKRPLCDYADGGIDCVRYAVVRVDGDCYCESHARRADDVPRIE